MNIKQSIFFILIFCLLYSCSSQTKKDNKVGNLYYDNGTQHLMRKDYTQALTQLRMAKKYMPKDSRVYNNLGMTYFFKKQYSEAIKNLEQSIELDPKNSDAKNNLASIYYYQGQIAKAKKLYFEILKDLEYPQFRVHYNIANIMRDQNNFKGAIKHLKASLEEKEDFCPSHFLLGEIKYQKLNYKEAAKSYRLATLGTCVKNVLPHYMQAISYLKMLDFVKADAKFNEIIEFFPSSEYALKSQNHLNSLNTNSPDFMQSKLDLSKEFENTNQSN